MNYNNAISNWSALSSGDTITGILVSTLKIAGEISESLSKLLGLVVK